MRFPSQDVTRFVIAVLALSVLVFSTMVLPAMHAHAPIPPPTPWPTQQPQRHDFPEMCNITHSYWLKQGDRGVEQPPVPTPNAHDAKNEVSSADLSTYAGQTWYDGFGSKGKRLFHMLIEDNVASVSDWFVSPNRQMAAVKVRLPGEERLELAVSGPGGPGITLKAGLYGLGDPIWSSNSKLLAFTQADHGGAPVTWQVVDTTGKIVWTSPYEPYWSDDALSWDLVWARCPR